MKKLEVKGILQRGVLLEVNNFKIELEFFSGSWIYTHGISVRKGRWTTTVWSSRHEVKEIINSLKRNDLETEKLWIVLRLINSLSYPVKVKSIRTYLRRKKIPPILKSVYYSMIRSRYGKSLRRDVYYLVRKLIRNQSISKKDKWAKKILSFEKRIFWKRVLTDEWNDP